MLDAFDGYFNVFDMLLVRCAYEGVDKQSFQYS